MSHATTEQHARIALLEAKLRDDNLSNDEVLELALLAIEPGHDAFRAAELLQRLIPNEAYSAIAKMWLAHCWIYEFMDRRSLQNAAVLCDEVVRDGTDADIRAAALMLKGAALNALGDVGSAGMALEASVMDRPSWVSNRQLLASVYQKEKRLAEA